MEELLIAVITALVTGIVTYFLAIQNARIDLDEATRKARIDEYKKLWILTDRLPRYPPEAINYKDLEDLAKKLRNWYFYDGGLFLSDISRDRYIEVQKILMRCYDDPKNIGEIEIYDKNRKYKENGDYELVRSRLSALRTQLTKDIGSRRMPGSVINDGDFVS